MLRGLLPHFCGPRCTSLLFNVYLYVILCECATSLFIVIVHSGPKV